MTTKRLSRLGGFCLGVAVGLAALVVGPFAAAADSGAPAFSATAEASGMYIRYGIPGFLVVENYIDGGGPVAQSVLASDGTAQSFASLPYPGPTFLSYPAVVALVTGSVPPGYPLYASAQHPTQPETTVSDPSGAYLLKAAAAAAAAAGDARFSVLPDPKSPSFVTEAHSDVASGDNEVVATAVSNARGITVGPLTVGAVTSKSVTTYRPGDAEPHTATEMVLEGGRVNGLVFSFGPQGLVVAQQGVPIPVGNGLTALNQALAPSRLAVRFEGSEPLRGGAAAAVFDVVSTADVPGAGVGTLRLRFGGATSFVSLGGSEDTLDTGQPVSADAGSSAGPEPGPATGGMSDSPDITASTGSDGIATPAPVGVGGPDESASAANVTPDAGASTTPADGSAATPSVPTASAGRVAPGETIALAGFPVDGGGGVSALVVLLAAGAVGGFGFLALAGWSRRRQTWSL
jgi:hypothetical protein